MKHFAILLTILLVLPLVFYGNINNAFGESQSFQVRPGETKYLVIYLDQGDTIQFSVSVVGGSGDDIDLTIENPNFETVSKARISGSYNYGFTSDLSGNYKFSFGNTFSIISSKEVEFSYDVTKPAQGGSYSTSSTIVGLVVFIAIIVVPIVVGISLYKKRKKKESLKTSMENESSVREDPKLQEQNQKALDILKSRLAKGEISKAEFDELRKEFEK